MIVRADTEVPKQNREMRHLRKVIKRSMKQVLPGSWFEVSLLLVGEERIKDLNLHYRGKDETTDVLSFPLMSWEEIDSPKALHGGYTELIGDIVICVPVAERQSRERGVSLDNEMEMLAIHGLLHLCGYDDSTLSGEQEMEKLASAILKREL
jgi:probable rRNA maturation factor